MEPKEEQFKQDETTAFPFEERVKQEAINDEKEGKIYLDSYHKWCLEINQFYHNAQNFKSLKESNKFPSTAIQEDVDQFVADARDKLFYADRPCTIFGREDSDKEDAEAKQEMMDYQDDMISIFNVVGQALKDAALYRICASKVEYGEEVTTEWEYYDEVVPADDGMGNPILDQMGRQLPAIDPATGEIMKKTGWRLVEVPAYKGAKVTRIDPMNLLWTQDKKDIGDWSPIMIRGNVSKDELKDGIFIRERVEALTESGEEAQFEDPTWEKKANAGETASATGSKKRMKYLEWYGRVDKKELYEFMVDTNQVPEEQMAKFILDYNTIREGDKCWAICGIVNGDTVVQLRKLPFNKLNRPNLVIGFMAPGEDSILGESLSKKTEAVQKAEEEAYGYLLENLKQAVNAFWIVNTAAITNSTGQPKVNKAGGVLETNTDVNNVAKRVDQPRIAPDIFDLLALFKQIRQDQGGLQDAVTGKGDPNAETLGEARQTLSYASLRMRDYLKTFEDSYIRPLYEMRNDINTEFLTEDYVYRVIGEKGRAWKKITAEAIRTPVDFICESASRETNRSIIIQQMLQAIQIAPLAVNMGQPVRLDLMMADLFETGFAMSRDKIKRYFPLIALEMQGVDVNGQLMQSAMLAQQTGAMPMPGQPQPTSPTQNIPNPRTEEESIVSNEMRNNFNA